MSTLLRLSIALLYLMAPLFAVADGLPLVDGRFPNGNVSVFTLTPEQEAFIACVRERYTDNSKTPYVFRLNTSQKAQLKQEAGISPERFAVYETYRGFNDAGPHWNLVLRFAEHEIEIPHALLRSDTEAEQAEFQIMGWNPNSVGQACLQRFPGF